MILTMLHRKQKQKQKTSERGKGINKMFTGYFWVWFLQGRRDDEEINRASYLSYLCKFSQ